MFHFQIDTTDNMLMRDMRPSIQTENKYLHTIDMQQP